MDAQISPPTLDETDRVILRGLIRRRWPFPELPGAMPMSRLRDIAERTQRLAPMVARYEPAAAAARARARAGILALFDGLALDDAGQRGGAVPPDRSTFEVD